MLVTARVRRLTAVLPPGTIPVGGGLVVSGLTAYAFLTIASRALGPTRYTPLGLLWAIVFVAAPGLFLPLEQEVGRALVSRRVRGIGGRPVIRKAAIAGGTLAVLVVAAAALAERPLVARIFDGEGSLLVAFVAAVFV